MRSHRSIAHPGGRSLSLLTFGHLAKSKGSRFDLASRLVIVGLLLGPIALGFYVSPAPSSSMQSAPAAYGFIGPELAAQGESFTGVVVEKTDKGDVPLPAGEQVAVRDQNVTVGPGGVITCPGFSGIGNVFLHILISRIAQAGQAQPSISHHVEVIKVPPNAPTRIAHTSNIVTPGTRFNVEGQGLTALQRAGLVSEDNKEVDLGAPIGSSLQRIYFAPPDLPKGNFRFVGWDAQGHRYEAPEASKNPTFRLSGDTVKQRGQRGQITLVSDTSTSVFLSGGEPQIKLDQTQLEVRASQPVKIGFTANELGPYTVRVRAVNNEDLPLAAEAPRVDAKPESIETRYDPKRNTTECLAPVTVVDAQGKPLANVPVDMALSHPGGVEYARVTTDQRGRASFLHTFAGRIAAEELTAHIFRILRHWWKQPPTPNPSPSAIPTTTERPPPIPTTTVRTPPPIPTTTVRPPPPIPTTTVRTPPPIPTTTVRPPTTTTRVCVINTRELPGPGIGVDAFAPTSGRTTKFNETVPLIVNASDTDQEDQSCYCPPGTPEHKLIAIVDSVNYNWTKLVGGGALDAGGPGTLYKPPDIPIGGKDVAVIQVEIKDSRGNDKPAKVKFTVTTERKEDCKYKRDIVITKETDAGSTPTFTGANECKPVAETWIPVPVPLIGDAAATLKLCVGERVVVRANGSDADTLELQCVSGECGSPRKKLELIDEMKYTWTASIGGFPDYGGGAVTNSQSTSVIYKAPDTPGEGTIDVLIQDSGKQASDAPIKKQIKVKVYKVNLQIDGLSDDDKECLGGYVCLNNDDDNENRKIDLKDTTVPGEDDLRKITLTKEPKEGKVTLKVTKGAGKIKVWEKPTKENEVKLPATFDASELPKDLWVEGVKVSDELKDVELVLESDDPKCQDKGKLTVFRIGLNTDLNIDGAINEADEDLKATPGAYIVVNNDDDDRDGTVDWVNDRVAQSAVAGSQDEKDLKRFDVLPLLPPDLRDKGQVRLSRSNGRVRVYSDPLKGFENKVLWSVNAASYSEGAEGNGRKTWDLSNAQQRAEFEAIVAKGVWVEGLEPSSAPRDTKLSISYAPPDRAEPIECDWIKITVVRFTRIRATIKATPPNTQRLGNGPVADQTFDNDDKGIVYYLHENPAGADGNRDSNFEKKRALVLVRGSLNPVPLEVTREPAAIPVQWTVQRSADDAANLGLGPGLEVKPPSQALMSTTAQGSFLISCYVDVNGNKSFDEGEPRIVLPVVLIRVRGFINSAVAQQANAKITPAAPTAATGVNVTTSSSDPWTAATSAVHNDATVEVVGGGKDGLRGLDQLFAGWVNNELAGAGSPTAPLTEDVVSNYRDPAPPNTVHPRISAWVQPPAHQPFDPYTPPPPPPPPPAPPPPAPAALTIQGGPVLDTTNFGNEGTGGNRAVGTEGAVGPPVAIVKTGVKLGQRWQVEMWDSPGDSCPSAHEGFPAATLTDYRFNLDFRSDLVFWTNVTGVPGPTADAACRLYSTVQTNTWTIRFAVTFDAKGVATITTPLAIKLTKDAQPARLAKPVAGSGLEVRAPISLRLLIVDARN